MAEVTSDPLAEEDAEGAVGAEVSENASERPRVARVEEDDTRRTIER